MGYTAVMPIYQAQDGTKIDLDPATVKLFEAFATATLRTTKDLAQQAAELLRPVLLAKPSKQKKSGA